MERDFTSYSLETQRAMMFEALKRLNEQLEKQLAINSYLVSHLNDMEEERKALSDDNRSFSKTNCLLWVAIVLSCLFGYWLRGM